MRETTSLPRLTAAALSRALNLEQGSRLLTVRLPGAIGCEALRECFRLNGNGVPNICELEPGKQNTGNDNAAPVFIDATACVRKRFREINSACEALINDLEPGYLGFCDWEAYLWRLYALALSGRTRAAVLLPFEVFGQRRAGTRDSVARGARRKRPISPARRISDARHVRTYCIVDGKSQRFIPQCRHADATPLVCRWARYPNLPLASP